MTAQNVQAFQTPGGLCRKFPWVTMFLLITSFTAIQGTPAGPSSNTTCIPLIILLAKEQFQVLHSPNYPSHYPSNCTTRWHVLSQEDIVEFQVQEIDLQYSDTCQYDYVQIFDGPFLNYSRELISLLKVCELPSSEFSRTVKSTGNAATIEFSSDSSVEGKSFSIAYRSLEKHCPPRVVVLHATKTSRTIDSPRYPRTYPSNSNCRWLITSSSRFVHLTIEYLDIEFSTSCTDDSLQVFDGNTTEGFPSICLCGLLSDKEIYTSKTNSVTILFRSNACVEQGGFTIHYSAVDSNIVGTTVESSGTYTGRHHGLSAMVIIAIIMGALCVFLSSFLVVAVVMRRKQRIRRQTDERTRDTSGYEEVTHTGPPPVPPPPPYSSVALSNGNTGETSNSNVNPISQTVYTVSHHGDENKNTTGRPTPPAPIAFGPMTSSDSNISNNNLQPVSDDHGPSRVSVLDSRQ